MRLRSPYGYRTKTCQKPYFDSKIRPTASYKFLFDARLTKNSFCFSYVNQAAETKYTKQSRLHKHKDELVRSDVANALAKRCLHSKEYRHNRDAENTCSAQQ